MSKTAIIMSIALMTMTNYSSYNSHVHLIPALLRTVPVASIYIIKELFAGDLSP